MSMDRGSRKRGHLDNQDRHVPRRVAGSADADDGSFPSGSSVPLSELFHGSETG